MARPRVAWFTPLQPVESGISLYSEDLLPILSTVIDIDVIVDGYRPSILQETGSLKVKPYGSYKRADYDLAVYQVGNSPVHLYMLPEIAKDPGLLVLHDTMLNHLFIQQAARNGTLHEYRVEMERRYGVDGDRAASRVLKGQAPDELFRFPMSEPLVEQNRTTIVHSEFARQQSLSWVPDADITRVPHGLHLPEYIDQTMARRALNIPEDQFLVASISHINPHKRLDVVLRAFKRLRQSVPARLILAGSISPNFPLARMVSHLGLEQVVDMPGYVSDERARLIAAAADIIVNLRYPTAGETSGSLLHSMAAGRPVLVSQTGSFTEAPEDAVIRIPVDALEERMLNAVLTSLAGDQTLRERIGQRARAFIREEHSLERWARGYVEVISSLTGLSIDNPIVVDEPKSATEDVSTPSPLQTGEVMNSVAVDVAELGLGGDDELLEDIASAHVELGLGVGMIRVARDRRSAQAGDGDG